MIKLHTGDRKIPRKLGDGLFVHSIFCHLGNVEWEVHTTEKSEAWLQLEQLYHNRFELSMIHEPTGNFVNFRNVLFQMAMDGMKIAKPNNFTHFIDLPEEKYVTYQIDSVDPTRALTDEKLEELAEGYKLVDVGNVERDMNSVKTIMELQRNAEFHIGADSGTLWTALSMDTPVKVMLNRRPWTQKHMEQDAALLRLLRNHDNVEIRW